MITELDSQSLCMLITNCYGSDDLLVAATAVETVSITTCFVASLIALINSHATPLKSVHYYECYAT